MNPGTQQNLRPSHFVRSIPSGFREIRVLDGPVHREGVLGVGEATSSKGGSHGRARRASPAEVSADGLSETFRRKGDEADRSVQPESRHERLSQQPASFRRPMPFLEHALDADLALLRDATLLSSSESPSTISSKVAGVDPLHASPQLYRAFGPEAKNHSPHSKTWWISPRRHRSRKTQTLGRRADRFLAQQFSLPQGAMHRPGVAAKSMPQSWPQGQ